MAYTSRLDCETSCTGGTRSSCERKIIHIIGAVDGSRDDRWPYLRVRFHRTGLTDERIRDATRWPWPAPQVLIIRCATPVGLGPRGQRCVRVRSFYLRWALRHWENCRSAQRCRGCHVYRIIADFLDEPVCFCAVIGHLIVMARAVYHTANAPPCCDRVRISWVRRAHCIG